MVRKHHVKLFTIDGSQAVRIRREFELPCDDVVMRKEGDRLVMEPDVRANSLLAVLAHLATLEPLDESFPSIPDSPPDAGAYQ